MSLNLKFSTTERIPALDFALDNFGLAFIRASVFGGCRPSRVCRSRPYVPLSVSSARPRGSLCPLCPHQSPKLKLKISKRDGATVAVDIHSNFTHFWDK